MIRQLFTRLQLLFAQGKGLLIGGDKVQVRALDAEPLNVRRIEPYGFSYRPKPGCQTYLVFPNGDRAQGIALIIGDQQYQMDLAEGEVALHDDEGNHVLLKRGGIIEAKAATKVIADAPLFETALDARIGGNLVVAGQTASAGGYYGADGAAAEMQGGAKVLGAFEVDGTVTVNGKDVSDAHTHTSTQPGSPTSGVN